VDKTFTRGYALIIGVGRSVHAPWSLPVTALDALALRAVLTDQRSCAYRDDGRHVRVIHDQSATSKAIFNGLEWLAREVASDTVSTAIVYFSGHGWLQKRTRRYYMIPHDVDPFDIPGSAIQAEAFTEALRAVRAERLLAIIDCCHAEGMAAVKGVRGVSSVPGGLVPASLPKSIVKHFKPGAGRAVFSSSRGLQSSWVRPDGKMSIYTFHLIEALQGANNRREETTIKLSNLMNYLGRTVPQSAQRLCNGDQVPFFDTAAEDFAVALFRNGKALPNEDRSDFEEENHAKIGRIVQAVGERSLAIGGDARGNLIITGDRNRKLHQRDPGPH